MANNLVVYGSQQLSRSASKAIVAARDVSQALGPLSKGELPGLPAEMRNYARSFTLDTGPAWPESRPRELYATVLVARRAKLRSNSVIPSNEFPANLPDEAWNRIFLGYAKPVAENIALVINFLAFDTGQIETVNTWWRTHGIEKTGLANYGIETVDSVMIGRDALQQVQNRPDMKVYVIASTLYDGYGRLTTDLGVMLARSAESASRVWCGTAGDTPAGMNTAVLGALAFPRNDPGFILRSPPIV